VQAPTFRKYACCVLMVNRKYACCVLMVNLALISE